MSVYYFGESQELETERLSLLKQEEHFLRTDGERYMECMNNRPLCERGSDPEWDTRDGLILFHCVYEFNIKDESKK